MSDFVLYHIIINNNKVSSTGLILKYTGLYTKRFTITMFLNIAECTKRLITSRIFTNQPLFRVSFVYLLSNKDLCNCC